MDIKTHLNKKIIKKCPSITMHLQMNADTIVKSILDYLQNSIKQKYYDFNQSMLKEDETYELKDPLICRHFIFKSFEEFNKKSEKKKIIE